MKSDTVSVVISPPRFDLESYGSLDEELLERTWDGILPDEASFGSSFDPYLEDEKIDRSHERAEDIPDVGRDRQSRLNTKSSFFPPSKSTKRQVKTKRHIRRVDSESEHCGDDVEEGDPGQRDLQEANYLKTLASAPSNDDKHSDPEKDYIESFANDLDLEEMEEDAFSLVEPNVRDAMVYYISRHPFFEHDEYPVKRSERCQFSKDIREKALAAGISEATQDKIVAYVKKLYLSANGRGHLYEEGSEFGEEIDDVLEERLNPPGNTSKDRKRKRASQNKSKRRSKEKAKAPPSATSSRDMGELYEDTGNKVMNLAIEDTAEPVLDTDFTKAPMLGKLPVSPSGQLEVVRVDSADSEDPAVLGPSAPTNQYSNGAGTDKGIHSHLVRSKLQESLISLDSKEGHPSPTAHFSNQSAIKNNPDSLLSQDPTLDDLSLPNFCPPKKSRNHRKRKLHKSKKTSKFRESLTISEDAQISKVDAYETNQTLEGAANKKPTPGPTAARTSADDPFCWDLDF
ncbi:hypothetical protein EYZ11_005629 [Aspergillus tanneri]|uniref:Uncharacterized protein n=1 Tax=Aspergillus tanneri TaxID=1220188 RepID=A0A4S3JJW0_9EURO|nr:hypothetical protein EYZ11_005629 [Aspergillus tanneri]